MRVVAEHYNYYNTCIIIIFMHKSGRRARDICIASVALVMLNFELSHEEDIICAMDLREYLSATPSTSSTATIVSII